jgi:MFS family permease
LLAQGGTLADRIGGKRVMAAGIAAFSLTSLLMPAALSPTVRFFPTFPSFPSMS